ncbi:NERD domain-containing protein [Streptomyces sp. NPDC060194]|uniref:NERD domain-containing protein n=1 Tax=Streptomyces sp. NPDC060194 TaxID=3347069 RepID=UPI00365B4EAC
MTALRVTSAGQRGDRLQVSLPDGRDVAWYDRAAARVLVLSRPHQEAALRALAPFLTGPVTVGPPPVPTAADLARLTLHPDDDLAPNRPGEALLHSLDRYPPRRRADPRRDDLAAQTAVGAALDALERTGHRALHSIPLPPSPPRPWPGPPPPPATPPWLNSPPPATPPRPSSPPPATPLLSSSPPSASRPPEYGPTLHHLLIGPRGVHVLLAVRARGRRVHLSGDHLALGRRAPAPVLRTLRAQAALASRTLSCDAHPVLVLIAPAALLGAPSDDITVLPATSLPALPTTSTPLKPPEITHLHTHARNRRTWLTG